MEQISYVRAFRRHWWVIALCVMLTVGAILLVPTGKENNGGNAKKYDAPTVLLDSAGKAGGFHSLSTLAYLVTIQPIAADAFKRIQFPGTLQELMASVTATSQPNAGIVTITGTFTDPAEAVKISEGYTAALLHYLTVKQRSQTANAIDETNREIAATKGSSDVRKLQTKLAKLKAKSPNSGFETIEKPIATLNTSAAKVTAKGASKSSLALLRGLKARLLLGILLGLALGGILSLVLERLDSRLRTSRSVSRATDLPVIAEIPRLPRSQRNGVVVATSPLSGGANAFRMLAAAVSAKVRPEGPFSNGQRQQPIVILVTSASAGEGKTFISANLAAVYAEAGLNAMIVSCDLRTSDVHKRFKIAESPGLVQVLDGDFAMGASLSLRHETLASVRQLSGVDRVTVVAGGGIPGNPSELLASKSMRALIAESRTMVDVVILDASALLEASDALPLLQDVDAVLMVARVGQLRSGAAISMGDLLHRVRAPRCAVVMNGDTEPSRMPPDSQLRELELAGELR